MANAFELMFLFYDVNFQVEFEDGYFSDDEKTEILEFVDAMSKSISIDKSYVECASNKRSDVFMIESGWNALRELILDSECCKYLNQTAQASLVEAFTTMLRCYMYECVSKMCDKFDHIAIGIDNKNVFDVVICKDKSNSWNKYPGRWQDWNLDEDGHFCNGSK